MQNKDIFTYSLILIPLLMLGFFFLFGFDQPENIVGSLGLSLQPMLVVMLTRPRIDSSLYKEVVLYRTDGSNEFLKTAKGRINAISIKGNVFKIVDGTDLTIKENGDIVPSGIGSSVITTVFRGGYQ